VEPVKLKEPAPEIVFPRDVVALLFSMVPIMVTAAVDSTIKLGSKFRMLLEAEINSVPFTQT
jgi:hypothetical protein